MVEVSYDGMLLRQAMASSNHSNVCPKMFFSLPHFPLPAVVLLRYEPYATIGSKQEMQDGTDIDQRTIPSRWVSREDDCSSVLRNSS